MRESMDIKIFYDVKKAKKEARYLFTVVCRVLGLLLLALVVGGAFALNDFEAFGADNTTAAVNVIMVLILIISVTAAYVELFSPYAYTFKEIKFAGGIYTYYDNRFYFCKFNPLEIKRALKQCYRTDISWVKLSEPDIRGERSLEQAESMETADYMSVTLSLQSGEQYGFLAAPMNEISLTPLKRGYTAEFNSSETENIKAKITPAYNNYSELIALLKN